MLKFIVLADIHIVKKDELSHGLDTLDRLNKAVSFVNQNHGDADFIIFAGDLADRGEAEAYERFKVAIKQLAPPVYITLGNHDHRPTFLEVFGAHLADETGNVNYIIDTKDHRVIVLDSSDPSERGAGVLEPSQIAWLHSKLQDARELPVIIVLHHNITKLHVQTDFIILKDNKKFAEAVLSHPNVRQVVSGHVHMTTSGTYMGVPFSTFAGAHYSIEPTLQLLSGPVPNPVARREGPGQLAVVLSDDESTVVHMENFLDRHLVMAQDLFRWKST